MKFHQLLTKLCMRMEKSSKFRQSNGNNSSITNYTLMKLHMHKHTMVINLQYKFHEIPYIGLYLQLFVFVLFDSLCPINNLSVMKGQVFLG